MGKEKTPKMIWDVVDSFSHYKRLSTKMAVMGGLMLSKYQPLDLYDEVRERLGIKDDLPKAHRKEIERMWVILDEYISKPK